MKSSNQVIIAGGTGLIGRRLSILLREKGYQVAWLTRKERVGEPFQSIQWNPTLKQIPDGALDRADHIIVLNGASIAKRRWSNSRKELLLSSRTSPHETILQKIIEKNLQPSTYISAAGIGGYGDHGSSWITEETVTSQDNFLVELSKRWEAAHQSVKLDSTRQVTLRIGIVISSLGGALPQMLTPLKFGVAPYFGNGQMYWSWIHIDDLCRMFIHVMENPIEGVFNATSPESLTNYSFVKNFAQAREKRVLAIPVWSPLLRLIFGEMSSAFLTSNRVSSTKIQSTGFDFNHSNLHLAISDVFQRQI